MVQATCRQCGGEFDEAEITRLELCAACDRSRQERSSKEQMKRLPLALVAGALAFLVFPLAILLRGPNDYGSYEVTNRGRTTSHSPETIIGFLVVGLIFVGVSAFAYFKYRDSSGSNEELSILGDVQSTDKSADQ